MANKLEPKYKKGDKFEIEISEVHTHYTDDGKAYNLYRVKGFNTMVFDDYGLDRLKKCEDVKEESSHLNIKICITKAIDSSATFKVGDLVTLHNGVLRTRSGELCNDGYPFYSVNELTDYFHGIKTSHDCFWSTINLIDFVVVNED